MNFLTIITLNLIIYVLSLKIFFLIFAMKYRFPFRSADLYAFFFNLILFLFISFYYMPDKILFFIVININLFYIFFHIINMIVTSPRTKIILDLKKKKNKTISLKTYLKKYNCKVIAKNRIERLMNNKQIIKINEYYSLKKNKNFLYFISLIFSIINKT